MCCSSLLSCNAHDAPADPNKGKDMVELAAQYGYDLESYNVTTRDGYILKLFRIPRGANDKDTSSEKKRPAVLLQHGLLDSSYTWVANPPEQSLGFMLADAGFDVFLGNNRGNRYSTAHETLDPSAKDGAFWEFTWDEMASQDLPSFVNFILDTTGAPSVGYVGHSEGTIQMFAASVMAKTSTDQFLVDAIKRVNLFVALAPVAFVSNMASKVRLFVFAFAFCSFCFPFLSFCFPLHSIC
jgi:lysosomal acid lipase/cholesteryl ester hydrolase